MKPAIDMKTQSIVYIGKKEQKYDNVAGTGVYWMGYGDEHEVPHTAAVKLLRHPDVWTTKSNFEAMEREREDQADLQSSAYQIGSEVPGWPKPLASPGGVGIAPGGVGIGVAPNEDDQQHLRNIANSRTEGSVGGDPEEEIPNADLYHIFDQLDSNDPNDFGAKGPKAARVSELVGRKVTVAEIAPAWEAYKAGN